MHLPYNVAVLLHCSSSAYDILRDTDRFSEYPELSKLLFVLYMIIPRTQHADHNSGYEAHTWH